MPGRAQEEHGNAMEIERLSGALGAEIHGIDLNQDLDDATVRAVRQALLDHLVIFFRDQDLPPERLLAFGRYFGTVVEYPFISGLADFPEITPVIKLEHETVNFGGVWHSDTTYLEEPPLGSILLAREVPEAGGDTMFANQYMAYETLSAPIRALLDGLHGISTSTKADVSRTREDRIRSNPTDKSNTAFAARHPAVRTHPETGRKALYVNCAHTDQLDGLSRGESDALLGFLFKHQVQPEFTCRFRWRPGSIAFWDNRAAQHYPVNDYNGYRRVMHRITLQGDRPY